METKKKKKNDSEKNVEANFVVQDHHLIKSTRVIALDKLIAREIYSVLLLSSDNSPTSQKYFGKVFPNDTNYCFTLVDIGSHGSINDTSTLSGLLLGKAFEDSSTNFCILAPLRIGEWELPYVLLGDDVFPLKPWLMKSYLEKNLQEC